MYLPCRCNSTARLSLFLHSLLVNGSINTLPRKWIHSTIEELLDSSITIQLVPYQRRVCESVLVDGGFVCVWFCRFVVFILVNIVCKSKFGWRDSFLVVITCKLFRKILSILSYCHVVIGFSAPTPNTFLDLCPRANLGSMATLLTYIREVVDSNLIRDTLYFGWVFCGFPQSHQEILEVVLQTVNNRFLLIPFLCFIR